MAREPIPNDIFRAARERLPSPSGAPRSMSRQELADTVNAYLYREHKVKDKLNQDHIGKIERGQTGWPCESRRLGLRAVLGATTDTELGFWFYRSTSNADSSAKDADAAGHGVHAAGGPGHRDTAAATFLGQGWITIVTPVKKESIKNRPVIAVEDVAGSQQLAKLARQLGLAPEFDHVAADGTVDLNRENLVVICGPRLSRPVAEVLARDDVLRFEHHRRAWTIVDRQTGIRYRSGLDQSPERDWDVGYLGRLPRPDKCGSLIVLTGIHPPGTLGLIQFISTQIASLFAEMKTDNFSALVGTHFDASTREPREVTPLTPIRRLGPI